MPVGTAVAAHEDVRLEMQRGVIGPSRHATLHAPDRGRTPHGTPSGLSERRHRPARGGGASYRRTPGGWQGGGLPARKRLDSARTEVSHPPVPQLSLHTPFGDLTVSEEACRIVALDWGWGRDQTPSPLLRRACALLEAYFDAEPVDFDLPLAPAGTPYQQRVWTELRRIPPGETRSYAAVAGLAGGSARSVGMANRANPIPILIPCHRVVATTGLGGYSGGDGPATKRGLLDLEALARMRRAAAGRGAPIATT